MLVPMHGIGGRGDLPVPLWLAAYSAAAAVCDADQPMPSSSDRASASSYQSVSRSNT